MNVAFDDWIPVLTTNGSPEKASLVSVLSEGRKYADLSVRPHERVALMRLFICVCHAALDGPKNYDEWLDVSDKLPEAVKKYLEVWKDSFELFHPEKPWLQVAGLSKRQETTSGQNDISEWTPVSKLNFTFATGNTSTLFDHEGMSEERKVKLEDTVLSMLTFQCFSPGGLISQVYWNGKQSNKTSKDAPCVPASMIHVFLRGQNLLDSIHLNLPTHEQVKLSYGGYSLGKPLWEMVPSSFSDVSNVENATKTYLGRLLPMTRLVLLSTSGQEMLLGDGLVYSPFTDGFPPEPTATVIIRQNGKKQERAVLSYKPSKAVWRELAALVVKRKADNSGGALSLWAIQDGAGYDLVVSALARDQAMIVDTVESVFNIPANLEQAEGIEAYETEVGFSEKMASRLGWAIEEYRREIDSGWEGRLKGAGASKGELKSKLHSIATTHFWTNAEKNLSLLMAYIEALDKGEEANIVSDTWRKMLFTSACDSYELVCGKETPRQIRAYAKGWDKLTGHKDEKKSDNGGKEENK